MAMTGMNLRSIFDLIHLDKYEPIVKDAMTAITPYYNKVDISTEPFTNKTLKFSFIVGENWGGGARNETDPWPGANDMSVAQGTVTSKYFFYRLNFGLVAGKEIKTPGALINLVARLISGTLKTAKLDMSRMFSGDGTGKMADVTSVSGDDLTVTNIHYFYPGQTLYVFYFSTPNWIHRVKTASPTEDFYVRKVDRQAGTITVGSKTADDAGDIAADDVIYMRNSVTLTAGAIVSKEWSGMKNIIAKTGTFQGLDRAANPWYQSYVNTSGSNRALTLLLLQTYFSTIVNNLGLELPEEVSCAPGVFRAFTKLLTDNNQTAVETVSKIGFKSGLKYVFNGKPITFWEHIDVPANTLWSLVSSALTQFVNWELGFEDTGGTLRMSSEYPEFNAFMTAGGNFGSKNPQALGQMDHITEV